MTVNRGLLNWGIFLIALGAVPLAVYWNVIDPAVARDLLRLWPLILIGIGVGLILRFTAAAAIGGILVAGTLGLLIGAVLAGGWAGAAGACISPARDGAPLESRSTPFAGNEARLEVDLSCAQLSVDSQGGAQWVVTADFTNNQPSVDARPDRLVVRDRAMGHFEPGRASREVRISVPDAPSLLADFTLNASTGHVDLTGTTLDRLNATFNASDVDVRLTDADMSGGPINMTLNASAAQVSLPRSGTGATANVSLNASSLNLCAPPELALSVSLDERLSSQNLAAAGLQQVNGAWQTPGFEAAAERLDLNISANVSSITLDRTGGCP